MKRSLLLSILLALPSWAHAQQALTSTNTISYDFAAFDGAGFAPMPTAGQLDSDEWIATRVNALDLDFGGTSAHMDFANGTSTGGEMSGGIWAFGPVTTACASAGQTLLGVQPSNRTFSPGSFRVRATNATGAPLSAISLAYTLAWLNDENRSMVQGVRVLQVDTAGAETGSVVVPSLMFETPVASAPGATWQGECLNARVDLSTIPIADGAHFVIAFDIDDGTGSGSRDELGITDVRIAAMPFAIPDAGVPAMDAGTASDAGAAGDAGSSDAGGADGGALETDGGGPADAGASADGGAALMDAGAVDGGAVDGGLAALDGGTGPGGDDGCGCSAVGSSPRAVPIAGLLGLTFLWATRRRRSSLGG